MDKNTTAEERPLKRARYENVTGEKKFLSDVTKKNIIVYLNCDSKVPKT